jgi:hypothetical protein
MTRWDYAFFVRPASLTVPDRFPWEGEWPGAQTQEKFESFGSELQQHGDEGWELVTVVSINGWLLLLFKKPQSHP